MNVYGTKDILYQTGISGYRESLLGFSADDEDQPLFNIEIKGAEHLYYMKRGDLPDQEWNTTVSDFVARLMLKAGSVNEIRGFLRTPPPEYAGCFHLENNRWVIELPGWQQREMA